jgi:hypothetical protein
MELGQRRRAVPGSSAAKNTLPVAAPSANGARPPLAPPHDLARTSGRKKLFDDENPASRRREDALHWMTVYGELAAYAEGLLEASNNHVAGNGDLAGDAPPFDPSVLRRELARYRRRLRFWTRRAEELDVA